MADYKVGDVVRDYVTIVDENMNEISGLTFTVEEALDPEDEAYAVSVTEIGGGTYRVTFTATKVGTYYWRVQTVGMVGAEQAFEASFVIDPFSVYGATIGTAAYGVTLNELIQMCATELGDFKEIEATENGSADGSNFVDTLRLAATDPGELKGASITIVYPEDSANADVERRILDSSEDSTQVTVVPNFPVMVASGSRAWLVNLHSRGWWRTQYRSAINNAIISAFPAHLVPVDYVYPDYFTEDDPIIPAPSYMTHVHSIQASLGDGSIITVSQSPMNMLRGTGWAADTATASLVFGQYYQYALNGAAIRMMGYGRPAKLTNSDDYTTVDAEWIMNKVAASLRWSKGEQRRFAEAANFQSRADQIYPKIITPMEPNTVAIR
jgi:hypothetical protein